MDGWMTVIVRCGECGHLWTTALPAEWDGSILFCEMCSDLTAEVVSERG